MTMTKTLRPLALAAALLAGACLSPAASAAESYDNCTAFIDSLPATLTTQGVWCLRKNLTTAINTGSAITIDGNNITIDCNDFKIGGLAAGFGSQAVGIYSSGRVNATVRNCGIRGFHYGVQLSNGGGHLLENNRLDQNLFVGILATGAGSRAQGNRVFDTGGATNANYSYGIYLEGDALDNTVDTAYAEAADASIYGIYVIGTGSEIRGNRVRGLLPSGTGVARGISAGEPGQLMADNVVAASPAVAGQAFNGGGANTFCTGNVAQGYGTAYHSCEFASGNLPVVP